MAALFFGFKTLVSALRWTWTQQIDPRGTLDRIKEKVVAADPPALSDFIATRDANVVYQDGRPVGDVAGSVQQEGKQILFAQLANTEKLDVGRLIEYKRFKLKIINIKGRVGMLFNAEIGSDNTQSTMLRNVMQGVLCELND